MAIIAGLRWMPVARLVRAQFLSLREKEFVEAARSLGAPAFRQVVRHILPNALGPVIVAGTIDVAAAIIIESSLSFLGLGFPPDIPTWGRILFDAKDNLDFAPHWAIFPARRSSSPCCPSTTSVTGCAMPSIRERCSALGDQRRAVLHAGHRPGSADPPSQGLPARADEGRAGPDRAREPVAERVLHGRRRAGAGGGPRATAALGKRGAVLGPLHGVPVSIKDLTPTKGIRTTWGSKVYEHHVPDADGLVVERLKAAGAIVVGKTNTPEFGAGANTFNEVFGVTRNPWNPKLTCGGSTGGGAVALATGLGPLAQGSDLGGSLRLPAAFCGVVGFRTAPGYVPVWPGANLWDTLSVQGPMARTVADTALMLSTLVGPRPARADLLSGRRAGHLAAVKRPSVKGLRIAWGGDLGITPLDHEVRRVTEATLGVFRALGARVEAAHPDFSEVDEIVRASRGLSMVTRHEGKLADWKPQMQANLVRNIEQGLSLTPSAIARGETPAHRSLPARARLHGALRPDPDADRRGAALPGRDALGPDRDQRREMAHYIQWALLTYAFTVINAPAISVPCGFTRDGLPVGLQIAGRWHDEIGVLRAAAAFEAAAPWAHQRPPV